MRGDTLAVAADLDVHSVNTFGGLERDRLRFVERFAKFLPVGFYYKAFHTPRRLFPFYEKQMRKVAGLGRINSTNQRTNSPKDYAFCDLLVVGAGPAGLRQRLRAEIEAKRIIREARREEAAVRKRVREKLREEAAIEHSREGRIRMAYSAAELHELLQTAMRLNIQI